MSLQLHVLKGDREPAAVRLEGLSKTFRDSWGKRVTALRDVTLSVASGEVFGILGPNGAGKSTTFKILLGLLRAGGGRGEILGSPMGSVEARARLGYLPESPYFYDYLTPQEFLATCAVLSGKAEAGRPDRLRDVLARVGLDPGEKRRLRKFSKGMLQRLGLAQAILHDPDLLILDEPMSGLDPVGRSRFRDIILELKGEGKTVIFASHVLPDVEALCDRVAILIKGKVRATGAVGDLVGHGGEGFEVEASGVPEAVFTGWEREGRARKAGDRVLVTAPDAHELETVVNQVFRGGANLLGVRPLRANLEDVFLAELARDEAGLETTRGAA